MSSFGRLTFAFCVPFTLVALLSMENGVAADVCSSIFDFLKFLIKMNDFHF